MTNPVAATASYSSESSSLVISRPEPVADSTAEMSVVPPVYMSTSASLGEIPPNYSSIAADQSSYCEALSSEISEAPIDASETPPETSTEASMPEAANDATGGDASCESAASTEEASAEESSSAEDSATSESADASEASGASEETLTCEEEEETADAGEDTQAAPAGAGGNHEEDEGIEALVTKLPRMAPIRTPFVASPPPQAIQRRNEIIKRTSSPPEQHHAQVRQAVEQVAQAARDAQRRMVWQIGNLAKDTRISIEDMADEIMKVTAQAVAQINHAINRSIADVGAAATERNDYLAGCTLLTGDALDANRNATNIQIVADLTAGSAAITELNTTATARFSAKKAEAQIKMLFIPTLGEVGRLAPPPSTVVSGDDPPPAPQVCSLTPTYHIMPEARTNLLSFIDTKSHVVGVEGDQSANYYRLRATPVLDGNENRTETQLIQDASTKADSLNTPATNAEFMIMLLGLTTPVSRHHAQDQSHVQTAHEREAQEQKTEVQLAHEQASNTITQKAALASEYLNRDLRDTLTGNIWKAGRKAAKGLRKQAAATEVTLNNTAVPMAEAYRDLVDRLNALLPPGQFLDAREIVPKLMLARKNAAVLLAQHVAMGKEQSLATIAQMEDVKKQQADGLLKSAASSIDSVQDVVTQTSFDMELFVMQMTGASRLGAEACMTAAQTYASHNAEQINKSIHGTAGPGLDRIDSVAVSYLNGNISSAEQSQFQQLGGYVEAMRQESTEGPLISPMQTAKGDLNDRSTALDNAMPERSTGSAIGWGLVSPIALGVYLYSTDADEDVVIQQLGNLMWPGVLALEEVFEIQQHHGSLRGRIRDRLSDPEETNALDLFNTSAEVRADARLDIANNSTGWFDYNRAARESALQGMSREEHTTLSTSQISATRDALTNGLNEHQAVVATAYLDITRERAVAARTREALDNGRKQGQWGWIFSAEEAQSRSDQARVDAIANMDSMLRQELAVENAFALTRTSAELRSSSTQVYREFASLTDPAHRRANDIGAAEAENTLVNYASQGHVAAILDFNPAGLIGAGPLITAHPEAIKMSTGAHNFIAASIHSGSDSNEARSARGVYEINRARQDTFGPSETTQTRLTDALENRELARLERESTDPAATPLARSRAARLLVTERANHRQRLQAMARGLGAPADVASDPARAEAWMRNQVGDLFANTQTLGDRLGITHNPSHRRYGEEMMTSGRASLDASVALATDGLGTHEDLLRHAYADRSHAEIDAANARWHEERGGSMEAMLGLHAGRGQHTAPGGGWFSDFGSETSGDLAMELEVSAMGNPENDLDRIAISNLRYDQQRVRGTGFIADHSMRGTDEQRFLDGSRADLARTILAEAVRRNPDLAGRFDADPSAIFNADGSINSEVSTAAFDDHHNFRGDVTLLQSHSANIGYAATAYKAEIDRQEAALTTGITVLALLATLVIMCIPGVNLVAAGIITAVLAGAATIAVKAGMRGGRYGWEEAATDVATTAIEAATAGFGGALGGGLVTAEAGGIMGRLARVGMSMEKALGSRIAAAVVREAIVGAISSAASTAIQDETWKDGLGAGLERVANGAIRGAVVSAVTTGISEGITHGLNAKMDLSKADPTRLTPMQRLAARIGPRGSEMLREGISNTLSGMVGESAGLLVDYAQGNYHGSFGDALRHIGLVGLREMMTSTARGAITSMHKANYHQMLETARRNGNVSESDLKTLRLFAISAGEMHYDQGVSHLQSEVNRGHDLLGRIPPGLREHVAALDADSLQNLVNMLGRGTMGDATQQADSMKYLRELAGKVPGLIGQQLIDQFNIVIAGRNIHQPYTDINSAQQQHLRAQLGSHLNDGIRLALDNAHLDGLQHLSETEIGHAAAMIAAGEFNFATADGLLRAAKTRNPHLDEFTFLNNLHSAVTTSRQMQETMRKGAIERRQQIVALVPGEAAHVFAQLGDAEIAFAQKLIRAGNPGTPQEQDSLFPVARVANPELTRDQFHGFMAAAASKVRAHMASENLARRIAREERMTHVPEELRGTLSALPEAALVELRLRQMDGVLSPAEKNRLVAMAQHETPGVDIHILSQALEQAVKHVPAELATEAQTADMRRHLLSAIPAEQQSKIEHTRIMVLPAEEFAAFTRSQKGQAVTLIINGEAVVIVREGANPRALREEGIHALQAQDPHWAKHIGPLDERTMAQWDSLPLEQQITLYRNKVVLELDAQTHLIRALENELNNTNNPNQQHELEQHLAQVKNAYENLTRRGAEVGGMDALDIANIKAGFSERPQWLDQPSRLFSKEPETTSHVKTEEELRAELHVQLASGGRLNREHLAAANQLSVEQLTHLIRLSNSEPEIARAFLSRANKSGNAVEFTQQLIHVMDGLSPAQQASARTAWPKMHSETLHELLTGLHELHSQHTNAGDFQALIHAATSDGKINVADVNEFLRINKILAQAETPIPLAQIISHFSNSEELHTILYKLGGAENTAATAEHLIRVLGALSPEQYSNVKSALAKLSPDVFTNVLHGFAQLAHQVPFASSFHALVDVVMDAKINKVQLVQNLVEVVNRLDAKGLHAMASLLDQTDVSMRGDLLDSLVIFSKITLRPLEQGLLGHDSGKLFNLLIETAATQRNWIVFMENAGELLTTMHNLPKTEANQEAIAKTLKYLFDARGDLSTARPLAASDPTDSEARFKPIRQNNDLLQLAADINAAANDLRSSPDREKTFNDQVKRQTTEGRLAGSDAWQTYLQNEALHWTAFKNDSATKNFADLLLAATSGWSDGELAAVRDMHAWFEHLATSRGIAPTDNVARTKLLNEVLDRGFGINGRRNLSSEGKMTSLTRAFRELAVEAHLGMTLDPKATRDPVRMQEALARLGLTEHQLAQRSDAEVIRKHIYDLVSREVYYEAMQMIANSQGIGDTTFGVKQNITEVIGEIALTQHMLTSEPDFRLETPFGKGTGFDQVWARRDTAGHVIEFVVGEAKGPGAQLGAPGKGAQMSAEWVFNTVNEMIASSDRATQLLGAEMMDAIKESRRTGQPIIRGMVIEAGNPPSSGSHNRTTTATGLSGYDFSAFNLPLSGP